MKINPALLFFLAFAWRLPAQLPQGSVAPDFAVQDIAGQPWHLYELLGQGKTVVLEFSTTWCPPCWAYQNSHALQDFYAKHGPAGDGTAAVFFIESDPKTNVACLSGQAGCNDFTPGNWTENATYPFIDAASLADSFKVSYFPTFYIVCPNKKAYQVGQLDALSLEQKTRECPVASGVHNAGIFNYDPGTGLREVCDALTVHPSFSLINLGSEALTSALVTLQWNSDTEQTKQWSGNLPLYGETTISFDSMVLNGTGILRTVVKTINNGASEDDFSNNVRVDQFGQAAQFNTQQILLKIKTDDYGLETYWELRDAQGDVLYHGGNSNVGPDGGGSYGNTTPGPGTYGDNVLINKTLTLPGDGCYSILFVDAYGDGMCCNYGNGYYKLYNGNNPAIPVLTGGEFEETDHRAFQVKSTTGVTGIPSGEFSVRVFPNPASDRLQAGFTLTEPAVVSVTVVNAIGQVVDRSAPESLPPGEHVLVLSPGHWPAGPYFLRWQAGSRTGIQKFLLEKERF